MLEKEIIIFIHALAAVTGMGTAIFLQIHAGLNLTREVRARDQRLYAVGHRVIMLSLGVLILSGLAFLIYYAINSPETLGNEKIYGKSLMVIILIINGLFINNAIQETLKKQIGKGLFEGMPFKKIRIYFYNGTISFVFWALIFVLGTFRTLNNLLSLEIYIPLTNEVALLN
ncbi:MAG: hypothetical protein NWR43_01380 [Alphaproteobacteria bacterium]|nr:hypothetical protein [Alphaproteobacteria bacterium]